VNPVETVPVDAGGDTCMRRAVEVRDEFAAYEKKNGGYRVMELSANIFGGNAKAPTDERSALALYIAERDKNAASATGGPFDGSGYANGLGEFSGKEPYRCVAFLRGTTSVLKERPCTYVIMQTSDEDSAWYRQATEIVVEMCEWVLSQSDPSKYSLRWSS
jgi:hypothetical protein